MAFVSTASVSGQSVAQVCSWGALMIPWTSHVLVLAMALFLAAVVPGYSKEKFGIEKRPFGKTSDGKAADLYVLTNQTGMQVSITNYGASIVAVRVPDRAGKAEDVVLGFDTAGEYETGKAYFGGTIGRYANRIAQGRSIISSACRIPKIPPEMVSCLRGLRGGFCKTNCIRITARRSITETSYRRIRYR